MKKKIIILTLGFLFMLTIDWVITMFSVVEDGKVYESTLGLEFIQETTNTAVNLQTSFTINILISYLLFVVFGLVFQRLFKANNN